MLVRERGRMKKNERVGGQREREKEREREREISTLLVRMGIVINLPLILSPWLNNYNTFQGIVGIHVRNKYATIL